MTVSELKTESSNICYMAVPDLFIQCFREYDIDIIQNKVAEYYNITTEMMHKKTRKREYVQARQVAMFFSKKLTKKSFATIGKKIGDKHHATVIHSVKIVNGLIDVDKQFFKQIKEIENILKQ